MQQASRGSSRAASGGGLAGSGILCIPPGACICRSGVCSQPNLRLAKRQHSHCTSCIARDEAAVEFRKVVLRELATLQETTPAACIAFCASCSTRDKGICITYWPVSF